MPTLTYDQIAAGSAKDIPISEVAGFPGGAGGEMSFTGTVVIDVPQLPEIKFPMEDYAYSVNVKGQAQDLKTLLNLEPGKGGKVNSYAGSQILINSDRIVLNSKIDYLMLFGKEGVAISSQGNVNIDADDAVTIFGEDGLFLGVPGKGEAKGNTKEPKVKSDPIPDNPYEPIVLGTKLANLIEDLLFVLKNATLLTPVGKGYFREDVMYELACLQARIPEILSTYCYVDGISHEPVDPAPEPPKTVTEPPTTLTGTVSGTAVGAGGPLDPNAPSTQITNALADQPDFFDAESLYGDGL